MTRNDQTRFRTYKFSYAKINLKLLYNFYFQYSLCLSTPLQRSFISLHEYFREGEDSNVILKTETEITAGKNIVPIEENPYGDSSNGVVMQDAINGYAYPQGVEDYNQLLGQYYELEEKRQQILQRLNQFGNWNYHCSGENFSSGAQWGTCSTSQDIQLPTTQTSHPAVVCSCCPYVSQCCLASLTTCSACSLGGACNGRTCTDTNAATGSGKSHAVVDSDIVNTAMGAIDRALSSLKTDEGTLVCSLALSLL